MITWALAYIITRNDLMPWWILVLGILGDIGCVGMLVCGVKEILNRK